MITIRRAGIEDIEDVVHLRTAFQWELHPQARVDKAQFVELTRDYVSEKLPAEELLVWFAEEDGQIVGTGGLVFWHRPPTSTCMSSKHAYVLNMYTLPDHRGKGVATLLLEQIIDYVKTTATQSITLHATEMGRAVYGKLGFVARTGEMQLKIE